jgi:hypothetical protein
LQFVLEIIEFLYYHVSNSGFYADQCTSVIFTESPRASSRLVAAAIQGLIKGRATQSKSAMCAWPG